MEVQDLTKRIKPESSLSLAHREERRQYLHGYGKNHISYFQIGNCYIHPTLLPRMYRYRYHPRRCRAK